MVGELATDLLEEFTIVLQFNDQWRSQCPMFGEQTPSGEGTNHLGTGGEEEF